MTVHVTVVPGAIIQEPVLFAQNRILSLILVQFYTVSDNLILLAASPAVFPLAALLSNRSDVVRV